MSDKAIQLLERSTSALLEAEFINIIYLCVLLTIIPLFSHEIASEKCSHLLWRFKHRFPLRGMIMHLCCGISYLAVTGNDMGIHWFLHLDLWFASAWMMTYFGCHILYQLSSSDERLDQECKLRCPHQQNAGATGIQASSWIKGSLRASISGLGSWARPCGEPSALSCAHLQTLGSRAFYNIHMPDRDPHCKQNPNGLLYSTQFHIPPRFLLQGSVLRKHPELLQVAHGLSYKGLSYRSSWSLWPSYISLKFINLKITTFSLESWLLESDLTEAFCHLKLSVLMHLSLFIFFSNYTISRTCKNNVAFFFLFWVIPDLLTSLCNVEL